MTNEVNKAAVKVRDNLYLVTSYRASYIYYYHIAF